MGGAGAEDALLTKRIHIIGVSERAHSFDDTSEAIMSIYRRKERLKKAALSGAYLMSTKASSRTLRSQASSSSWYFCSRIYPAT